MMLVWSNRKYTDLIKVLCRTQTSRGGGWQGATPSPWASSLRSVHVCPRAGLAGATMNRHRTWAESFHAPGSANLSQWPVRNSKTERIRLARRVQSSINTKKLPATNNDLMGCGQPQISSSLKPVSRYYSSRQSCLHLPGLFS